ncbi:HlyD family type I secretion periplasmic adaptor subunit [Fodinicurvata halophila]|uniref:Membrane fusion protein (MFP) family protein n=1 Tax=Fodinicurvata halophila TaxID=1419723 RepID=A0ABV8UJI0_9PROT
MSSVRWKDYDYAKEVKSALHQGTRRSTQIFLFVIIALIVTGVVWAANATVDEITRGDGRVIPSSQLQKVQSLEGGSVQEILVEEGDLVEKGQTLLKIDDTSVSSNLGELMEERRALRGRIARLEAEVKDQEEIEFPEDIVENDPETVQNERELFEARKKELEAEISIARQQARQRELELKDHKRQEDALRESLELAQEELAMNQPLAERGVVPRVEILRLRREVNDLESELQGAIDAQPRAEAALEEAHERIQNIYLRFRSEAQQELNNQKSELAVIEESLKAARDRVVRTDITAPVDGVVNALNVNTIGAVVQSGEDIVEIVPVDDKLLIEARIRPKDVAFLRPGLEATVKLTSYDYSVYGGLKGEITRIGADTRIDEETDEPYYRVIVETEKNYLGEPTDPLPIIPGMVASVDIMTGEKTILDYLLKPLTKARQEALTER